MPFLYLERAQITLQHEPDSEISAGSGIEGWACEISGR